MSGAGYETQEDPFKDQSSTVTPMAQSLLPAGSHLPAAAAAADGTEVDTAASPSPAADDAAARATPRFRAPVLAQAQSAWQASLLPQAPGASKPRPGAADATLPAAVLAQALKQSAPIRFPVIPSCTGSRPGAMMKRLLAASARPGADDATLLQQQGARPLACATMDNGQDARQYN
jgi:hypothetical protein